MELQLVRHFVTWDQLAATIYVIPPAIQTASHKHLECCLVKIGASHEVGVS